MSAAGGGVVAGCWWGFLCKFFYFVVSFLHAAMGTEQGREANKNTI